MKFFVILVANSNEDQSGIVIVSANDADEAFGIFLDGQDLDIKEDKDEINLMLEQFPIGIGELPELPTLNENFYENIQLEWYYSV